nr:PREDICTED: glutamate-rich protein 4-like [Equus przewalskii]
MELWRQLRQARLVPMGQGPPPPSLRGILLAGSAGSLLWIWEELGNLHQSDVQILGQLCSLRLEMRALWEEPATSLEEEEEEDEEPEGKLEEGHLGISFPAKCQHLSKFEMTI